MMLIPLSPQSAFSAIHLQFGHPSSKRWIFMKDEQAHRQVESLNSWGYGEDWSGMGNVEQSVLRNFGLPFSQVFFKNPLEGLLSNIICCWELKILPNNPRCTWSCTTDRIGVPVILLLGFLHLFISFFSRHGGIPFYLKFLKLLFSGNQIGRVNDVVW